MSDDSNSSGRDETDGALAGLLKGLAAVEPAMPLPKSGDRFGRYRLVRELGRGGFAVVFVADDAVLGRQVAVKLMRPRADPEQRLAHQFYREASLVARLRHPNIVTVFDWGTEAETPFLVLELLHGRTLAAQLHEQRYDLRGALALALRIVDGLAHAHTLGVLHRDLKPANIFLGDDGSCKILDFGLAQETDGEAVLGHGAGTPRYLAPEAREKKQATAASDVYSFGLVLFELLSERRDDEPPPPGRDDTRWLERAPSELRPIIAKCLAPIATRYADATAVLRALRRVEEELVLAPRRRLRIATWAAAIGLATTATAAVVWQRAQTSKHARAAASVAAEVNRVEAELRFAHLSPPHDTRPDQERAEAMLARMTATLATSNEFEAGLAAYALGRGALALDHIPEAETSLRRALLLGVRGIGDDSVESALGEALGRRWRIATEAADAIADPERRKEERARLDRELRQPAVALLQQSRGGAQLGAARLALWSLDYARAITLANDAAAATPWLYEASLIAATAHHLRASDAFYMRADRNAALADLQAARERITEAARIGRSDPRVYEEGCALGRIELRVHTKPEDIDRLGAIGETACTTGFLVAPDRVSLVARAADQAVQWAIGRSKDRALWTQKLDRALALADAGLRVVPDSIPLQESAIATISTRLADLYNRGEYDAALAADGAQRAARIPTAKRSASGVLSVSELEIVRMRKMMDQGQDPTPLATALATSLAGATSHEVRHTLAVIAGIEADWASRHGGDPEPAWQRAIAQYEAMAAMRPNEPRTVDELGSVFYNQACWARDHGKDAGPMFARSMAMSDRVMALVPNRASTMSNAGSTLTDWAANELDWQRDAGPLIARAIELLEKSLAIDDGAVNGWFNLSLAQRTRAAWLEHTNQDPRPAFAEARRTAEKAMALAPEDATLAEPLADALRFEGRSQMNRGESPLATFAKAEVVMQKLSKADPTNATFARAYAEVLMWRAEWLAGHGGGAPAKAALAAAVARVPADAKGLTVDWLRARLALVGAELAATPADRTRLLTETKTLLARQPAAYNERADQKKVRAKLAALETTSKR